MNRRRRRYTAALTSVASISYLAWDSDVWETQRAVAAVVVAFVIYVAVVATERPR